MQLWLSDTHTHTQTGSVLERVVRCNFMIWCLRAAEVTTKNMFMQSARIFDFFLSSLSLSLSFPFSLFLIIYSFWEGKKREK